MRETCNGQDDDCDGEVDENLTLPCSGTYGQGVKTCRNGQWSECAAPAEVCDGKDNDGDGQVDESLTRACTDGKGTETCQNGIWIGCSPVPPEVCDGKDNDGDGKIDEDLTQACSTACGKGTETCQSGKWSGCTVPVPQTEVCDGKDNDCDGQIDEEVKKTFYADNDGDTYGNLSVSVQACVAPSGYVANSADCDDTNKNIHPGASEISCNGKDDDCAGGDDTTNCPRPSAECDDPAKCPKPSAAGCMENDTGAIDVAAVQVKKGCEVKITLRSKAAPQEVKALGFELAYDPAVLEYVAIEEGSLVSSFDMFNANTFGSGRLKVAGFSSRSTIAKGASGDLAYVTFKVIGGQENECYPLQVENVRDDMAGFSTSGGCFCISRGCTGDLNGDGTITPMDALMAFQCYLGLIPCPECADVNQDKDVTPSDALCLFQEYLGLPNCLDVVTLSSIAAEPASFFFNEIGQIRQLTVTGTYTDGSTANLTSRTSGASGASGTSYVSSNPQVATVTAEGLVTASGPGTATITVTHASVMAAVTMSVILSPSVTPSPPAPTVNIKVEPATITSGGTATLTWTSTNATAVTIDHDLGTVNPSGSITLKPTVTTTYTITATGSGGKAQSSVTCTVTVAGKNTPPTVTATARPANGPLPVAVAFTGTGTDPDGRISLYEWDFDGDDTYDWTSATTGDTSHTYNAAGIYQATLRVTDNQGAQDTESVSVTIGDIIPLRMRIIKPYDQQRAGSDHKTFEVAGALAGNPDRVEVNGSLAVIDSDTGNRFSLEIPLSPGNNTITVEAVKGTARVRDKVTLLLDTEPPMIKNVTPAGGPVLGDSMMIEGEVTRSSTDLVTDDELYVSVNGTEANLDKATGHFSATCTIDPSSTASSPETIAIMAMDGQGNESRTTTSVYFAGDPDNPDVAVLTATPTRGAAPLAVTFLAAITGLSAKSGTIDFDDGTSSVITAGTPVNHTYTKEKIFHPTLTVIDGKVKYSYPVVIQVDITEVNANAAIQDCWNSMKHSLTDMAVPVGKRIENSLANFSETTRERFNILFHLIKDDLIRDVNAMGTITPIRINNEMAAYDLESELFGEKVFFEIDFIRDEQGNWKILQY